MVESVVGEIIISACSLAIIVLAALPWYKVTDPDIDLSVTVRVWPQWLVLISAIILMLFTLVIMVDKIFDFFALSTVLPVSLAGGLAILSFSILAVIFKPTEVTVWGFTGTIESTDIVKVQWDYFIYTIQFIAGVFAGCGYIVYKRRKGS